MAADSTLCEPQSKELPPQRPLAPSPFPSHRPPPAPLRPLQFVGALKLRAGPSVTSAAQVVGSDRDGSVSKRDFVALAQTLQAAPYSLPRDVARHLCRNYGSRALAIGRLCAASAPSAARLSPAFPIIAAEVRHAVRAECALRLEDVLARRTRLAFLDAAAAEAAAPAVAAIMAEELGWDGGRVAAELAAFKGFMATMRTGAAVPQQK